VVGLSRRGAFQLPLEERKLLKEINARGCFVQPTGKNHYKLIDPRGNLLTTFAVSHKRGSKREVKDVYVRLVRASLAMLP
jgi:hypothetical protein